MYRNIVHKNDTVYTFIFIDTLFVEYRCIYDALFYFIEKRVFEHAFYR